MLRSEAAVFHNTELQDQHYFTKTSEEQSGKAYFSIFLTRNSLLFSVTLKHSICSELGGRTSTL